MPTRKIAIFTGKFKPPHRGHYDIIKQAEANNDELVIFVSGKAEGGIDAATAIKVLNEYIGKNDNVKIKETKISPVKAAYQYIHDLGEDQDSRNCQVSLYAAPEDMDRFDKVEDYKGNIKSIKRIDTDRPKFSDGEKDLYSRDLRKFIADDDYESFKHAVPDHVQPKAIWKVIKEGIKMTVPADSFEVGKEINHGPDPNVVPVQRTTQHPIYRDGFMNENRVLRFSDFLLNK